MFSFSFCFLLIIVKFTSDCVEKVIVENYYHQHGSEIFRYYTDSKIYFYDILWHFMTFLRHNCRPHPRISAWMTKWTLTTANQNFFPLQKCLPIYALCCNSMLQQVTDDNNEHLVAACVLTALSVLTRWGFNAY